LTDLILFFQIFVASRLNVPGAWQMPQVTSHYVLVYLTCIPIQIT